MAQPSSRKWQKMARIYELFAQSVTEADFSQKAADEMYLFESKGIVFDNPKNGYAIGKKWMDTMVKQWRRDIKAGLLFPFELEAQFPSWWLKQQGLWR